jgi:hypothetical protein
MKKEKRNVVEGVSIMRQIAKYRKWTQNMRLTVERVREREMHIYIP